MHVAWDREIQDGVRTALGCAPLSPARLALLTEIASIYEREGVIEAGHRLPLWQACADAAGCWSGLPANRRPGETHQGGDGGIALPWVGRGFTPGGVAVLGLNLRDASGLFIEYDIAWTQMDVMSSGGSRPHHSPWAAGSARAAAAVLASMDGQAALRIEDPQALAQVLNQIARLQSVKCSPDDGRRSHPTPAMCAACPPRFLKHELSVLRPGALVSFGNDAWGAIEALGEITESIAGDHYSRSVVDAEDQRFEMVWLHHPSGRSDQFLRSYEALLADLADHPIGQ